MSNSADSAPPSAFEIAARALDAILNDAAHAAPEEACGLLLGTRHSILEARPTANVAPDRQRHFEIDPAALIAAHRAEREGGPELIGYYHSHPTGLPEPSATDRTQAAGDGRVWAIAAGGRVEFWRDCEGGFEALSYSLIGR